MLSYRQLLKQSLKISWKNKYLWFFGVFAAFLSIGSEYQILARSLSQEQTNEWLTNWQLFFSNSFFSGNFIVSLFNFFKTNPISATVVVLIMLIILAFVCFFIWLTIVAQISLINNIEKISKNRKDGQKLEIKNDVIVAQKKFWPVFTLNLISKIVVNVLVFLVAIPWLYLSVGFSSTLLYVVLFVILVPSAIVVSLLIKYIIAFIVLKKKKNCEAVKAGWELFRNNWIISVEMALILFGISFVATLLALVVVLIIIWPFMILAAGVSIVLAYNFAVVIMILAAAVIITFVVIFGSWLTVYQAGVWTNLFLTLVDKGGESKLERMMPENLKLIAQSEVQIKRY